MRPALAWFFLGIIAAAPARAAAPLLDVCYGIEPFEDRDRPRQTRPERTLCVTGWRLVRGERWADVSYFDARNVLISKTPHRLVSTATHGLGTNHNILMTRDAESIQFAGRNQDGENGPPDAEGRKTYCEGGLVFRTDISGREHVYRYAEIDWLSPRVPEGRQKR
jgi:hypothetical protein